MKVDHIGYLVKSIAEGRKYFISLGYVATGDVMFDAFRGINILFMKNGETVVELIEPVEKDNAVGNLMKKTGVSPYHICYVTDDLDAEIKKLRAEKYIVTTPPTPAPAIEGRRVAFLYNKNIGLIEVLEG